MQDFNFKNDQDIANEIKSPLRELFFWRKRLAEREKGGNRVIVKTGDYYRKAIKRIEILEAEIGDEAKIMTFEKIAFDGVSRVDIVEFIKKRTGYELEKLKAIKQDWKEYFWFWPHYVEDMENSQELFPEEKKDPLKLEEVRKLKRDLRINQDRFSFLLEFVNEKIEKASKNQKKKKDGRKKPSYEKMKLAAQKYLDDHREQYEKDYDKKPSPFIKNEILPYLKKEFPGLKDYPSEPYLRNGVLEWRYKNTDS